ncbi:MAG TPA: hypothetical protein VLS93_18635 [Anaeromyxobacteraceae bacterium]|nr:hypothetical protein [Anaeromyxobacteraceae bacterium]
MANTFESGAAVKSGYYLDAKGWTVHPVAHDGERLPAGRGEWRRIPTVAALALTPIPGLLFLMFLPVIGFALATQAAGQRILRVFRASAIDLAATVGPGWAPGEAHLTGKRGEETPGTKEEAKAPGRLDALEKEIGEKRNG